MSHFQKLSLLLERFHPQITIRIAHIIRFLAIKTLDCFGRVTPGNDSKNKSRELKNDKREASL